MIDHPVRRMISNTNKRRRPIRFSIRLPNWVNRLWWVVPLLSVVGLVFRMALKWNFPGSGLVIPSIVELGEYLISILDGLRRFIDAVTQNTLANLTLVFGAAIFSGFVKLLESGEGQASRWSIFLRRVFACLLYTSPSPRDQRGSRMPSSA